jgi:hypothetical protein
MLGSLAGSLELAIAEILSSRSTEKRIDSLRDIKNPGVQFLIAVPSWLFFSLGWLKPSQDAKVAIDPLRMATSCLRHGNTLKLYTGFESIGFYTNLGSMTG